MYWAFGRKTFSSRVKRSRARAQEGVVYGSFRLSKRFCGDAGAHSEVVVTVA